MKKIYEATIERYSFIMTASNLIEVWLNTDDDFPLTYITVEPNKVKNEKDFQKEISWWFMDNA